MSSKKMTQKDASRIQSSEAKKNGGKVEKNSFGSRTQSAGVKNENQEKGKK